MSGMTSEAEARLRVLLNEVPRRGEVAITRQGAPVPKPVPVAPGFDRAIARKAAEGMRRVSQGATLGGLRIKDLVNEGRA